MSRSIRLGVAATVAALAAGTAALAGPSAPTAAQTVPSHVAEIVDFGASGGIEYHCSPDRVTSYAALADGFTVHQNQSGLITQINNVGTPQPNDTPPLTLYWSWWHFNGQWTYAQQNPTTYTPTPGRLEGWVYGDGSTPPNVGDPADLYAKICAGQDPTAAPRPSTTAPSTPNPPHSAPAQPAPTAGRPTLSGTPASTWTVDLKAAATHAGTTAKASPSNSAAISGLATGPAPGPSLVLRAAPAKPKQAAESGFPPWGTALALAVVAALGGVAFWRTRRPRGDAR